MSEPVVDRPDSVTHYTCDSAPNGETHHIVNGKCRYCKKLTSQLVEEQRQAK